MDIYKSVKVIIFFKTGCCETAHYKLFKRKEKEM